MNYCNHCGENNDLPQNVEPAVYAPCDLCEVTTLVNVAPSPSVLLPYASATE